MCSDALEPVYVKIAKQYDKWSCGHRIIAVLRFLVRFATVESCEAPLASIKVPDHFTSNDSLLKLSRGQVLKLETNPTKSSSTSSTSQGKF